MCGQTVRVIKGLRLGSASLRRSWPHTDNDSTIEEILEVDNQGDREGDRGSDNLKAPSEKESDRGDNLEVTNKENEIKLDSSYDNPTT